MTHFEAFSSVVLFAILSVALICGEKLNDRDKSSIKFAIVVSSWTFRDKISKFDCWFIAPFLFMTQGFSPWRAFAQQSVSERSAQKLHLARWLWGINTGAKHVNETLIFFLIQKILIVNEYWYLQRGAQQAYKIGLKARKRYEHLLQSDGIHLQNDIHVMTSSVKRCLKTAQNFIIGFLVATDFHQVPIAIHPIPMRKDKVNVDRCQSGLLLILHKKWMGIVIAFLSSLAYIAESRLSKIWRNVWGNVLKSIWWFETFHWK